MSRATAGADRKVRYAVVGLGHIAQAAIIPAFAQAGENSELCAFVSGDPDKLLELSTCYRVAHTFSYQRYEECLRSGCIDAVYIALPNSMHREYAVVAARAGIHVLCEKPLALTEVDCAEIIHESRRRQIKLMVANRLHFATAHQQAITVLKSGLIGDPRIFNSLLTMQVKPGNFRLRRDLGGGPLYDIGIYCIGAARQLFGEEPQEVFAFNSSPDDSRFTEVEESTSAILRFSQGRLAAFTCSFGAERHSFYEIAGATGVLRAESAYDRAKPAVHHVITSQARHTRSFRTENQIAAEIAHFSECVLNGSEPLASGEDGLADVRVIQALLRSAKTGQVEKLEMAEALFTQS